MQFGVWLPFYCAVGTVEGRPTVSISHVLDGILHVLSPLRILVAKVDLKQDDGSAPSIENSVPVVALFGGRSGTTTPRGDDETTVMLGGAMLSGPTASTDDDDVQLSVRAHRDILQYVVRQNGGCRRPQQHGMSSRFQMCKCHSPIGRSGIILLAQQHVFFQNGILLVAKSIGSRELFVCSVGSDIHEGLL